jgi:hypothetical protein
MEYFIEKKKDRKHSLQNFINGNIPQAHDGDLKRDFGRSYIGGIVANVKRNKRN